MSDLVTDEMRKAAFDAFSGYVIGKIALGLLYTSEDAILAALTAVAPLIAAQEAAAIRRMPT